MTGKARLIVISAPSGGGKTTLCQRLITGHPELVLSISTTTRAPRGGEQNGREYFFLSQDEFKKQIARAEFAEWAEVHGNFYGTSKSVIANAMKVGKSVLLDIDVQGARSLRESFPEAYYGIFISPPSLKELEARLRARGTDSEESIQKRLANAKYEMEHTAIFNRVVINDSLDRAYTELRSCLTEAGALVG